MQRRYNEDVMRMQRIKMQQGCNEDATRIKMQRGSRSRRPDSSTCILVKDTFDAKLEFLSNYISGLRVQTCAALKLMSFQYRGPLSLYREVGKEQRSFAVSA